MKIRKIPLISYCHYPALWDQTIMYSSRPLLDLTLNDGQVGYNILFNVLTSVITANKVLIQSNYARKLLENAISFYKIPYKNKIGIIQPPVDSFLFDKKNHYNTKVPYMSFLYNHRLYKSYGSENFLSLSDKVIEKYNLESMIFDSMPNRSAERVILNGSPEYYKSILQSRPHTHLINGHVDRYIYKENLLKNLFAMAAFRKTCVWSMAAVDCMCLGLPVIAPNYASYPEFIPQKLLFNSETEALQIIHKLLYDKVFRKKASNQCFNNIKKYEATKICDKLLKVFNKELSKVCVE